MSAENISERMSNATESARQSYGHAKEAARQVYETARERASDYYAQGKAKAMDYEQQLEDAVRGAPIRSVLIAAGAGLLLGMLLRRR